VRRGVWLAPLRLPPSVVLFRLRALAVARRYGDPEGFRSLSVWRLSRLLVLARGRDRIVELGTALGWTALSLVLANPRAVVETYDMVALTGRDLYPDLVPASARARVRWHLRPSEDGPAAPTTCDLLLVDADHRREPTRANFLAWYDHVAPGGLVVFDDFAPDFPGVVDAVRDLGLDGEQIGRFFVHRKP
jgi:predicted O-methyltransferase YrrM